jgi:hypothetical protein
MCAWNGEKLDCGPGTVVIVKDVSGFPVWILRRSLRFDPFLVSKCEEDPRLYALEKLASIVFNNNIPLWTSNLHDKRHTLYLLV